MTYSDEALASPDDLVRSALSDADRCIQTVSGHEDDPWMIGYAEYGIPWWNGPCSTARGLQDIANYRKLVVSNGAAWMDNTTLLTATTLLSEEGPKYLTPLTLWDLVTFVRAVVCYERIYHHEHQDIDDQAINSHLGADVLVRIPLPLCPGGITDIPGGEHGPFQWMCNLWDDGQNWLKSLSRSIGKPTLDGEQITAVTEAWRRALRRNDIQPEALVDFRELSIRWTSPSNTRLRELANVTNVGDSLVFIDPNERFQAQFRRIREFGVKADIAAVRLSELLSDLNLRTFVNQRVADFFELPYACSAARLPFRRHLYDRAVRIQDSLTVMQVIENRYAELTGDVRLRLPVFISLALLGSSRPMDIWDRLRELRLNARHFRGHRAALDAALARRDLKEIKETSKALYLSVDQVWSIATKASVAAATTIIENVALGDVETVKTGITAAVAAGREVLKSSFRERLMWRLRRPHLLWLNSLIDQAQHLTESLPDLSRIWQIPDKRQSIFAERFAEMARLEN